MFIEQAIISCNNKLNKTSYFSNLNKHTHSDKPKRSRGGPILYLRLHLYFLPILKN